jgi:hypothetical protein
MSEVLRTEVKPNDFCKEVDGQKFINTNLLPKYIEDWENEIATLQGDVKEERFQNLLRVFRGADIYFRAVTQNTQGEPPSPLPQEVQLSLSILHATLVFAAMHIFRNDDDPSPSNFTEFAHGIPVEFVKTLLLNQHWCPSDIALLEQGGLGSTSSLELYYAYLLGDRKVIRDHSGCGTSFKGRFVCKALDIDEDKYEPKHINGCQGDCGFIEVDENWLGNVYQANLVPLITVSVNDAGLPYLETHESDFTTRYLAVSHVYADGLGNPQGCGLPACQLKRLQARVNFLDPQKTVDGSGLGNIPFWMDTLCVPVKSGHIKKAAIRNMADIYSRAKAVLVLNAELEYHSCYATGEEVLMRITTSAWFRRLWTLQEGVLANMLYFQFNDGAVDIESLKSPEEYHEERFSIVRRLRAQAMKPYMRIRAFREMSREQRIRAIYPLIQWRATTHAEDEPYCLATLLLEDKQAMHKITATRDFHQRREEFILGQGLFPVKSLFFCETRVGTREPPIGWALRSYLYRLEPEVVHDSDALAPVDKEGLHVNLSGITFPISDLYADQVGQPPNFTVDGENAAGKESGRLKISSCFWLRDQNKPWIWTDICRWFGAMKVGILFEKWPLEYEERYAGWKSFSPTRGAIVAITEETRDKITGFFCGTAVISKSPEPSRRSEESKEYSGVIPSLTSLLGDVAADLLEIPTKSDEDVQNWATLAASRSGNNFRLLQATSHSPRNNPLSENGKLIFGEYVEPAREWCVK